MFALYLHGFASSARSSKATFLAGKFRQSGIDLHTPDLNEPDFSTLTITRMVDQVVRLLDARPDEPVVLIGSSLGAFVAVQVAVARPNRVRQLILLAPALEFGPSTSSGRSEVESTDGSTRMKSLSTVRVDEWKRAGRLDVFHYGYGRMMPVHYGLYADASQFDCVNAPLSMPILVFQGRHDDAVNPAAVEQWSRMRPNVELHMLDDGHQLSGSLDYMWKQMERFLGISGR